MTSNAGQENHYTTSINLMIVHTNTAAHGGGWAHGQPVEDAQ
jgi:hypothetical protein